MNLKGLWILEICTLKKKVVQKTNWIIVKQRRHFLTYHYILKATWGATVWKRVFHWGQGLRKFSSRKHTRVFLMVLLVYICGGSSSQDTDPKDLSRSSRQAHSNPDSYSSHLLQLRCPLSSRPCVLTCNFSLGNSVGFEQILFHHKSQWNSRGGTIIFW